MSISEVKKGFKMGFPVVIGYAPVVLFVNPEDFLFLKHLHFHFLFMQVQVSSWE